MNTPKIMLGDKVKDTVSGYTGIAVARTVFLNGCVQYSVMKRLKPGETLPADGTPSIDDTSLVIVEKRIIESKEYENLSKTKKEKETTGGPTRFMRGMRGY